MMRDRVTVPIVAPVVAPMSEHIEPAPTRPARTRSHAGGRTPPTPPAPRFDFAALRILDGSTARGAPLPYARDLEHAFGQPLGDVQAFTGRAAELRRFGAQALTVGNTVVFAAPRPSAAVVAHEAAHVLQNRNAGAARAVVAPRHSPAEAQADRVAALVATHGPGVALPAITAVPAAHVHLAPDPAVQVDVARTITVELVDGDRFRVRITQDNDAVARISTLEIDVSYVGEDDLGSHHAHYSLLTTPGRPPNATLRKAPSDAWRSLEIDLYGDGTHVTKLTHAVILLDGWNPPSRAHRFTATGPYRYFKEDEVVVKSKNAVPAAIANAKPEGLAPDASFAVVAAPSVSLPSGTSAFAAKRLLDDLVSQVWRAGLSQLQRRVTADHAMFAGRANNPAAAGRFARLVEVIEAVRPMMLALEAASKREAYLEDIANGAIHLVSDVKQLYGAAIEEAYDSGAGKKLAEATQAFDALWSRLAWMYIESSRGVGQLISSASFAVHEVANVRRHTGRGAAFWPSLERLLGVPGTTPAAQTLVAAATTKTNDVRAEFLAGKTGSLATVTEVVEDAQLVMGMAGLLAANESFHAFRQEMAGVIGRVFNRVGEDLWGVCTGYITKLEALLTETEKAIRRGDLRATGKAVIGKFQDLVTSKKFAADLEDIQGRIKWIKAIELIRKVLVIVGAAALTGGAAGAAIGGMLEGAGATAGVVAVGEFAAEVVTFTLVSRLGNEAVFGKNDTGFAEDLVTNTVMFGFLKAATAGYSRVFKLIANPKAHKTAYTVGAGLTGMVSLHLFAEAHFLVKEGKWMSNGDRARAIVQNATMLVALGLGGHLAKPLSKRLRNNVLIFTATRFPRRLEKIGVQIAELEAALRGMTSGDPTAAARALELIQRIERLWNEELSVLAEAAEAARKDGTAPSQKEFTDVVSGYIREIAKLELQLAQGGLGVDLGAGNTANYFRPITPGFVAFRAEGREVIEAFYREHKGTFEKLSDDLYAGKVNGEETFYVPEHSVKKLLLDTPYVAGLADVEAGKPKLDPTTDAKTFGEESRAHAEKLGKQVGGPLGATAAEIEGQALDAELQIELGLRILDPVFGKPTSHAFRDAATAINAEPDAATRVRENTAYEQLDNARARLQKQLLDVMRDPTLDIAARKRALHGGVAEFEAAVRRLGRVKPDAIGFAEAHRQIDALTGEPFKRMVVVNADGNLTQQGAKLGTLRALAAKIKAINNLFRKNGVAKELVLSISTPNNPTIPAEVKVLSRMPKPIAPTAKKPAAAVDPTDQAVEGTVVDIGVGLGDYAREAAGETGELVKTEYGNRYADPSMIRRDLAWEHTGPRLDVDAVLVLGDALQTLPMMFGARSVKRLFINHINASYAPGGASYKNLARGLGKVMAKDGRVEVQWTDDPETTGDVTKPRGHITGDALLAALEATGVGPSRGLRVVKDAKPVLDYDYSIAAPRAKSGVSSKTPPTNPVPKFRWIFTFGG